MFMEGQRGATNTDIALGQKLHDWKIEQENRYQTMNHPALLGGFQYLVL
jgi:hypothetical protein